MKKPLKKGNRTTQMMLAPYSLWSVIFIVVPLLFIAYYAFTDNNFNFTLENITRFFTATSQITADDGTVTEVRTYIMIFMRSLKLAIISTVVCLLMGYPLAYIMARAEEKTQRIMMTLIMIPMWMNFLIRTYAIMVLIQDTGIINSFLGNFGIGPIHILGTEGAVIIGMVYDYLPFMILPIYSVMSKLDNRLIEAASDLGCNGFGVLRKVILPLSVSGVISGVTMVLVPSISTFYISQKLGGVDTLLIGDVIEQQYTASNYNMTASLSLILMIILLVGLAIVNHYSDGDNGGGMMP